MALDRNLLAAGCFWFGDTEHKANEQLRKIARIIMRFAFGAVILSVVVCSCAPSQAAKARKKWDLTTRVEFYVGDALKHAPKYRVKSFHKVGKNNEELAGRFHGLALEALEGGEYEYELAPEGPSAPRGYELTGHLNLWASAYWVTLQAPDPIGPDFGEIDVTGRVTPYPRGKDPIWVRLQNVLKASQSPQAKVNPDGSFRIPVGLISGNFVVTVCRGGDVLYLSVVHFSRTQPDHLDITLPSDSPK